MEGGRAPALVTPAGNHGRIGFTHKQLQPDRYAPGKARMACRLRRSSMTSQSGSPLASVPDPAPSTLHRPSASAEAPAFYSGEMLPRRALLFFVDGIGVG